MFSRRQFISYLGRTASIVSALPPLCAQADAAPLLTGRIPEAKSKAYGSGYFGEWIEDEWGLPAYNYTCDQTKDSKAVTPVDKVWRSPTDHTHQVGNDRLVAAVSNYGYVQVRQDEGGPKFLNDYAPERSQYGGGIGYLTDGKEILGTFYPGKATSFQRIFGVGYLRKKVEGYGYSIDQVVFAPFGDDPLLVSQVTVGNLNPSPVEVRWVECWGCQIYEFSWRSTAEATVQGDGRKGAELRRQFAERFTHHFRLVGNPPGLLETKHFQGREAGEEKLWQEVEQRRASLPGVASFVRFVKALPAQATLEDLNPPPTFLVPLDGPADAFATNGKAFFGNGGVNAPDGLRGALAGKLDTGGRESNLLLERRLRLKAGERRTIYFAYGYLPKGVEIDGLLERYRPNVSSLWERSSARWKEEGLRLKVESSPWVDRELTWHHYYLRSNLTYDDFFQEHILSQGGVYQYRGGLQGAARDPLQHALPLVFSSPEIVRSVLRYTLKEVQPDGAIPYGITGHGMPTGFPESGPDDQQLFLLWLASEYVLGIRDVSFLSEEIPTYPLYGPTAGKETVRNLIDRCYRHVVEVTGTGNHGLMHFAWGDWNDALFNEYRRLPEAKQEEARKQAESVLSAAMSTYVLAHYARLLDYVGDHVAADKARGWAETQRQAVRRQWQGQWFRRAWFGPELGWLGDEQVWLEPQPWAIIGGSATPEQARELVQSLDELVRRPSPIGAMLLSKGTEIIGMINLLGMGFDGGVWPSINGTLIWALAMLDGAMAWDEWRKNLLSRHAEVYPTIWYGIWSAPDVINSILSKYPGQTLFDEALVNPEAAKIRTWLRNSGWTDWPVMNMHPHAWPLYSAAKLLGVEFTEKGVSLTPSLPLPSYEFTSPLVGLKKSGGLYEGWYAPSVEGTWTISLRLPPREASRLRRVEVNGRMERAHRAEGGAIEFKGMSAPGNPMRWLVRF